MERHALASRSHGSLFQQTTEGFEILVVADFPTDGSPSICGRVGDPRLRVVERPRAGLTAALNRLLEETRHRGW